MKIAQIVTLVSPDGAYGGPLRVAVNQSQSLIDLGHEVVIFAGYRGYGQAPTEIQGVPTALSKSINIIPFSGFAGTFSLPMILLLRRQLSDFDIIHIHMARDLITLPAAAISKLLSQPYVLQMHGMVDPTDRWLAKPLDLLLTVPILKGAARILVLTDEEQASVSNVSKSELEFCRITNGVPVSKHGEVLETMPREVLFMARLHEIKRPAIFARVACELAREYPDVIFSIVGPDEGEGPAVDAIIQSSGLRNVRMEGAVRPENALERMRRAHLFVLPSRAEVVPMSILEAMSVGVPVVVSEPNGIAAHIQDSGSGYVVDQTEGQLKSAISKILSNDEIHKTMAIQALSLVRSRYSAESVAHELIGVYRDVAFGTVN